MAHNAQDLAGHVEHRTARGPPVDRRIRLEELGEGEAVPDSTGLATRADVTNRQRMADAVRRADDKHFITDPRPIGVGEASHRGIARHLRELEQRHIGVGLGGEDLRANLLTA